MGVFCWAAFGDLNIFILQYSHVLIRYTVLNDFQVRSGGGDHQGQRVVVQKTLRHQLVPTRRHALLLCQKGQDSEKLCVSVFLLGQDNLEDGKTHCRVSFSVLCIYLKCGLKYCSRVGEIRTLFHFSIEPFERESSVCMYRIPDKHFWMWTFHKRPNPREGKMDDPLKITALNQPK